VLALSIIIFGVFEYQDQSELIDSSLRSLKRDPMPGVIMTTQTDKSALFIEPDPKGDARTVEIIESANQPGSIPVVENTVSQAEIEDTVSQVEIIEAAPAPQLEIATAETEPTTSEVQAEPVQPKQPPVPRDDTDQVASLTSSAPSPAQTDAKHNLHFTSSTQYPQTDIWLREAYAAYRIGDNQLALSLYNQVLEVDPANRNALLARAAIHMQDGEIDAAIRDYQALLLANPKDSLAMSSLLAVSTYSPQETESQLKLMIREEPDSPYLNFALANAYGAQKRWQEAQRHYFMALQNNPNDPNYAYNLAVSLEHISQPSSAITYYQRALDNFTNGLATFNRDVVNQRLELLGKL
jgi:Flp pilus assembly protein TadD